MVDFLTLDVEDRAGKRVGEEFEDDFQLPEVGRAHAVLLFGDQKFLIDLRHGHAERDALVLLEKALHGRQKGHVAQQLAGARVFLDRRQHGRVDGAEYLAGRVEDFAVAGSQVVVARKPALDFLGGELGLALRLFDVGEHPALPPAIEVESNRVAELPADRPGIDGDGYRPMADHGVRTFGIPALGQGLDTRCQKFVRHAAVRLSTDCSAYVFSVCIPLKIKEKCSKEDSNLHGLPH